MIERPNNLTYVFGGHKWVGKPEAVEAIRDSSEIQTAIIEELRRRDLASEWEAGEEDLTPTID